MSCGRSNLNLVKLGCALGIIVPLLTGCWDRMEIEERAVVLGIAIDAVEGEENKEKEEEREEEVSHLEGKMPVPRKEMIRITAQIAVPGRIPLGPGGGGGAAQSGQATVWALDVAGHTIQDAIANLQQEISGTLFFGHLRIIIISEKIARRGLENYNDFFRRNPEVRRMSWMIVTKGNAAQYMRAAPELERVPTLYLMATVDEAVKMGKFPENFVGKFWSDSSKLGKEGILPYVEKKKKDNVLISGIAYFRGSKMVGTTNPMEISFYMAIRGLNPAGYEGVVEMPDQPGKYVVFRATNRHSKMEVRIRDGRPHFRIKAFIEGNIIEKSDEDFALNDARLQEIQEKLGKEVLDGWYVLVERTQKEGADIFGFGEQLRAKKPGYWDREIRTKENWQEMYRDVPIDLDVSFLIRRTGMKAR